MTEECCIMNIDIFCSTKSSPPCPHTENASKIKSALLRYVPQGMEHENGKLFTSLLKLSMILKAAIHSDLNSNLGGGRDFFFWDDKSLKNKTLRDQSQTSRKVKPTRMRNRSQSFENDLKQIHREENWGDIIRKLEERTFGSVMSAATAQGPQS